MFRYYGYTVREVPQLFTNREDANKFCEQNRIDPSNIVQLYDYKLPIYVELDETGIIEEPDWVEP
jgi:hypothetical protein